jgi:hypothetical protein
MAETFIADRPTEDRDFFLASAQRRLGELYQAKGDRAAPR